MHGGLDDVEVAEIQVEARLKIESLRHVVGHVGLRKIGNGDRGVGVERARRNGDDRPIVRRRHTAGSTHNDGAHGWNVRHLDGHDHLHTTGDDGEIGFAHAGRGHQAIGVNGCHRRIGNEIRRTRSRIAQRVVLVHTHLHVARPARHQRDRVRVVRHAGRIQQLFGQVSRKAHTERGGRLDAAMAHTDEAGASRNG